MKNKPLLLLLLLLGLVGLSSLTPIRAQTFTVTNTNDDANAGSLRKAMLDVAASTLPGPFTIVVSATGTINLTSVLPDITKSIAFVGPGASNLTIRRNSGGNYRIFHIPDADLPIVSFDGFTIADGFADQAQGGAIENNGLLTVSNCVFRNNQATYDGGAIRNQKQLTIVNCTFTANSCSYFGGGIYHSGTLLSVSNSSFSSNSSTIGNGTGGGLSISGSTPNATITNSLFTNNSAGFGGGMSVSTTVAVTNCTFSRNRASNNGGGGVHVAAGGNLTVVNSTFTLNENYLGGGIRTEGTILLKNCIVAGNSSVGVANDIFGSVDPASSYNLIGTGGSGGLTDGTNNNRVAVTNVLLAPLADYGGPVLTHALLPGSPAINAGTSTGAPTTDARGIGRVGNTDVGAFESQGFTLELASGNNQSTTINTTFTSSLVVSVTGANSEPVNGGFVTYTAPGSGASVTPTSFTAAISGGQASGSVTANATAGGPYNVAVTAVGATSSPNFSLTNIPERLTVSGFSATPFPVCEGSPITFTATIGNVSGSYAYTLTNGSSTTTGNSSNAVFSQSLTASGLGAKLFTLTVDNGRSTSDQVSTIVTPAPPVPNLTGTTVIQNTPGVVLSSATCWGTFTWTGPNGISGSGPIPVSTATVGSFVYQAICTAGTCASEPASATVVVTEPTATGSFDGFVNGADCESFRGWAWNRDKSNTAISVEILDGPMVIGTLLAGDFRQDLLDNGKGNGKHGFRFTFPESIKDGLTHILSARVAGSNFILKDSPKALICQPEFPVGGNNPPQPPTPTVLIAPLVAQVGVPFSGTLVAFSDPEGTTISYGLSGLPAGLSLTAANRVISGTPTVAGSFVLAYTATDADGASNSVSFVLTVNPAATTTVMGNFEGYLDKLDCAGIRGWIWDRDKPNTPITVEFYLETTSPASTKILGSTLANTFRQDLKDAGKGNGAHGYSFAPPAGLQNGAMMYARVLGSTYALKGSPKAYQCAPARLSAEGKGDLSVTVLGNPIVNGVVEVEIRGAEGQPLQVQLTDGTGRFMGENQVKKAGVLERQRFSITGQSPGLLVLRVNTPAQSKTVKVLKID